MLTLFLINIRMAWFKHFLYLHRWLLIRYIYLLPIYFVDIDEHLKYLGSDRLSFDTCSTFVLWGSMLFIKNLLLVIAKSN